MKLTADPYLKGNFTLPIAHWDNIFTNDELDEISNYCSRIGTDKSATIGVNKFHNDDVRSSSIKFHNLNVDNEWIFQKLLMGCDIINQQFYNYDLYGFNYFQYTQYNGQGSHYDYHSDMFYGNEINHWTETMPRKLSFSLILSDPKDYEGGEFEVMIGKQGQTKIPQARGRLLGFPSFIVHRVNPIITGQRKSLVFWALGPKFK